MSNEKRLWIIEARDGAWGANGICKGELVRCKDCLYHTDAYPYDEEDELIPTNSVFCQHFEVIRDKNWFCADGERRTDGRIQTI